MKLITLISSFLLLSNSFSQIKKDNYKELGTKYVLSFFEKFNNADSTILEYFAEECNMTSTGSKGYQTSKPASLISELMKLKGRYEEKVYNISISGDYYTMSVSMDYSFYFDDKLHHCGKNFFILSKNMKKPMTYQIVSLADSRIGCDDNKSNQDSLFAKMDANMLKWHKAAGEANYEMYFKPMDSSFIYLGTDPAERWTKKEFGAFCKPYFSKNKGWDFKTVWRNWYISEDGNILWFEELLDTHMGKCRGSGVWEFTNGKWKIHHYNLALTIYNESMEDVKKANIKK
jgi:hypothetical protein